MEIIHDSHRRDSTIVTRQLGIELWHDPLPNPTIADSILNRLVHDAHQLLLNEVLPGWSVRERAACTDAVVPSNSQSLGYNKSNRLQSAAGPWGSKTYTYDGTGNRTTEVTGAVTDTLGYPGGSNSIANVVTGTTTTRTFTHDGAGNITTDVRSDSTYAYGYNARGRLTTVHQDGNLKGTYQYNSLEQLTSRVVTNVGPFKGTIHTTQDRSGNIIAEADGTTGVVAKEYIWLPGAGYAGTDLPVGVVDAAGSATPELLYVHADHLSRPIRLTDAAKVTAWAVEWLPWGGLHSITGSETLNARFPGQWFQVESGLHYNWHRHYDPTIGRYTQPDPLGFVDGPSVYAYARNAPGEFVDPNGEFAAFVPHVVRWIIGKLAKDAIKKSISPQLSAGDDNSNPSPKPEAEPKPRKRGKNDPVSKQPFNPGRDCNGKCKPCPSAEYWEVDEPGHGGDRHMHGIEWNQDPTTCMCYPRRVTKPL